MLNVKTIVPACQPQPALSFHTVWVVYATTYAIGICTRFVDSTLTNLSFSEDDCTNFMSRKHRLFFSTDDLRAKPSLLPYLVGYGCQPLALVHTSTERS